jgi:hypothetical protein
MLVRPCDVCGYVSEAATCPVCGSDATPAMNPRDVEHKIQEVTREIVELAADPDFREMPAEVREELFLAAAGVDPDDVLRDEYRRQIGAWRDKGFDVSGAERLLNRDLDTFRRRSARLIRAQARKGSSGGSRCPLCEFDLPIRAKECENCGARFD